MPARSRYGRSQAQPDNLALLAPPESGHQKNVGAERQPRAAGSPHPAKSRPAISRLRPRERASTPPRRDHKHRPSPRRTRSHALPHAFAPCESFAAAWSGRLLPRGTRRHAAHDFCCASHFRDYSVAARPAHVTPGLLPAEEVAPASRRLSRERPRCRPRALFLCVFALLSRRDGRNSNGWRVQTPGVNGPVE